MSVCPIRLGHTEVGFLCTQGRVQSGKQNSREVGQYREFNMVTSFIRF